MIFGVGHDRSLWLMLEANKLKRRSIADFVSSIPEDFMEEIKLNIVRLDNYKKSSERGHGNRYVSNECVTSGDMVYWYSLDMETGILYLGQGIKDDDIVHDTFSISLYPLGYDEYYKMECLNNRSVGEISEYYAGFDADGTVTEVSIDGTIFAASKLPFDRMMVSSVVNSDDQSTKNYRCVNMNKIPCNYYVRDLEKDKLNKLIRYRRRVRF